MGCKMFITIYLCSYRLTAACSYLDIVIVIVVDYFVIPLFNVYILYRNKYSTSFNFVDLIRCAVFLHMHKILEFYTPFHKLKS